MGALALFTPAEMAAVDWAIGHLLRFVPGARLSRARFVAGAALDVALAIAREDFLTLLARRAREPEPR